MKRNWMTPNHAHLTPDEVVHTMLVMLAEETSHPDPDRWANMMTGALIQLVNALHKDLVKENVELEQALDEAHRTLELEGITVYPKTQ